MRWIKASTKLINVNVIVQEIKFLQYNLVNSVYCLRGWLPGWIDLGKQEVLTNTDLDRFVRYKQYLREIGILCNIEKVLDL